MFKRSLEVGAVCERGTCKQINQDNIFVGTKYKEQKILGLFAVADGVGGLEYGEIASGIATGYLDEWWNNELEEILKKEETSYLNLISKDLTRLFKLINKDIMNYGHSLGIKAGTTLSVLFFYNDSYIVKHIGDSRIYSLNKVNKKLTMDHSWIDEQVMAGNLTKEEALNHPKKNVLTQCLGLTDDIRIFEYQGRVHKKECFLLATDGLYNQFNEFELLEETKKIKGCSDEIQEKAEAILEKAINRVDNDNLSLIIIAYKRCLSLKDITDCMLRKIFGK